jgi:4-hydroxybenzoate polyprenyltransferase
MNKIRVILELVKFEHTVFALPFAYLGAWLAAAGPPPLKVGLLILAAMVGARTAAMAFNRIADARIDALNPRTAGRPLPSGRLTLKGAWTVCLLAATGFFIASGALNTLALILSPPALGLILVYSYTKRFTAASHLVLGLALAIAPIGGWIAVRGDLNGLPLFLGAGVLFWVAGFDVLYACQDESFDRRHGLHSIPARWGTPLAFKVAGFFHFLAFLFFALTGRLADLGGFYFIGLLLVFFFLFLEHLIISPHDLSRLQTAFFTLNGAVSICLFVATWLEFRGKVL